MTWSSSKRPTNLRLTLFIHRIVDERPEGYVTKGDANEHTDQSPQINADYATDENIAGVVVARFAFRRLVFAWCLIVVATSGTMYGQKLDS